jgi:hypothetical protein
VKLFCSSGRPFRFDLRGGKTALVARRFDGQMVFVPEGQHDRSLARSAWVKMQRGLVPEGRLKA